MEYLMQKVSYLKGLSDGLGIEETSKEGILLLNIVETLDEFAEVLNETIENQDELGEYVDFIDEDLAEVEDDIYGIDEELEYAENELDFDDLCDDDCCSYFEDYDEDEESE